MSAAATPDRSRGLALAFGRRRLTFTAGVSTFFGVLYSITSETSTLVWIARTLVVGGCALAAFGLFEQWPPRLPRRLERWVLQLLGVVIAIPLGALLAYWLTTGGHPDWENQPLRVQGLAMLTFSGVLFAPWIALGAMVRQRDAFVRNQALAFELERSELERRAADARLRLLQSQVEPHFLFNTLANVQALVAAGSPHAPRVLDSLIAYLRAAVPRLDRQSTTLGHEVQLVRAYLDLMQMRIPDRLQFTVDVDDAARDLECPPMTLLTLVENAVRHGVDPAEEGGRIAVSVRVRDGRCQATVRDTGVGLQSTSGGLGTGLSSLRERLQLAFGGDAQLRLSEATPHGVCAEVEFPARRAVA